MKANRIFFGSVCVVFLIASTLGCSKKAGEVEPTAAVVANVDKSFASADAEAGAIAKEGVASLKNNDLSSAYEHFRSLSDRSDLTPQQRTAASAAFVNVLQQARAAADKGDPQAQALVKSYMASK